MALPELNVISQDLIHELVEQLGLAHPLTIQLFPISTLDPFGSRGNIRSRLAAGVQDLLGNLSEENRETLLDVRSRPTFRDFTYSISHTGSIGSYAILPHDKKSGIGIDLESSARVTDRVCNRVCESPLEVASSPSPALLWTAKEAAFKALCHFCLRNGQPEQQPKVISQLEISDWKNVSDHVWTYNFKSPHTSSDGKSEESRFSGRGAAFEAQNLSLSVAVSV